MVRRGSLTFSTNLAWSRTLALRAAPVPDTPGPGHARVCMGAWGLTHPGSTATGAEGSNKNRPAAGPARAAPIFCLNSSAGHESERRAGYS